MFSGQSKILVLQINTSWKMSRLIRFELPDWKQICWSSWNMVFKFRLGDWTLQLVLTARWIIMVRYQITWFLDNQAPLILITGSKQPPHLLASTIKVFNGSHFWLMLLYCNYNSAYKTLQSSSASLPPCLFLLLVRLAHLTSSPWLRSSCAPSSTLGELQTWHPPWCL